MNPQNVCPDDSTCSHDSARVFAKSVCQKGCKQVETTSKTCRCCLSWCDLSLSLSLTHSGPIIASNPTFRKDFTAWQGLRSVDYMIEQRAFSALIYQTTICSTIFANQHDVNLRSALSNVFCAYPSCLNSERLKTT